MKFPQGEGSAVIHRKKNDLLYKDITCLCHSLVRLWVLFLVVLFLLALSFLLPSILGTISVCFTCRPSSTELFFLMVLFFLALSGCFYFWDACFVSRLFLKKSFFVVLLLLAHRRAPFSCHCFSLGLSLGPFSTQILFVVVLFSLVLSMVPLLVQCASFLQSCFTASFTQLSGLFFLTFLLAHSLLLALFFSQYFSGRRRHVSQLVAG